MNAFIKKENYNFIRRCLNDLNNTLRNCVDNNILETNKMYIQEKIFSIFDNLSEAERKVLDISKIDDPLYIDKFLNNLNNYVYGMPTITQAQISKLFRKEKKLKLPSLESLSVKTVYIGWIDEGTRKLFIIYNKYGKLLGMPCRLQSHNSNNANICALCNHVSNSNEITSVSVLCKTSNPEKGTYKSIAFNVCLNSADCNERITSTEKLEIILKEVNNIK